MLLARVEGNVVATRKHPSFDGWRLVICQPINNAGDPEGVPQVAIDPHGAGMHQRVIISSDGLATRKVVGDKKSPARWMITAIVDEKEPGHTYMKAPSANIQAPEKHQASNSKIGAMDCLVLGIWSFSGAWCLGFGAFAK